jgi:hypothetical protein
MVMKGTEILCSETVVANHIIEQVKTFKYLGNTILISGKPDMENKINSFNKINGIIK